MARKRTQETAGDSPAGEAQPTPEPSVLAIDRRSFLGGVGGATVAALAGGTAVVGSLTEVPAAEAVEIAPGNRFQRKAEAFKFRVEAAKDELLKPAIAHPTNGDEELYPSRIGNFHKTLPHNALGEVDAAAYNSLLNALDSGDFADFEAVPKGGTATYLNPIGGLIFNVEGPDNPAVACIKPPRVSSPEWAAQMAELYWMSLLRDVPTAEFDSHPLALAARASLAQYSGYTGPGAGGAIGADELFRMGFPGSLVGPMQSQFLFVPFAYDAIPIDPKISAPAAENDFLTYFPEVLARQNGQGFGGAGVPADVLHYPYKVRDLGHLAQSDRIYSQYFRALNILSNFGGAFVDDANPYKTSTRQGGFATFGLAHATELVGKVHKSERQTWYQKWFVHRFHRPEAGALLVHNTKAGTAAYPIHADLLGDSDLLDRVFEYNRQRNLARPEVNLNQGSWLLSQMARGGSPSHPSFPAGHAVSAGACITFLKAWFKEDMPFPNPVQPSADGLSLEPYTGPTLTIGGELNKLCQNLSLGRDMSGVHWRADTDSGAAQGEEVAIRILREERKGYPEPFTGFTLTKFDGTTITI